MPVRLKPIYQSIRRPHPQPPAPQMMVGTTNSNTNQVLPKRWRCWEEEEDLLGRLPDEIVVHILSKLSYAEAAQTSVLSRQWEKLWTLSPNLSFSQQRLEDYSLLQESRERFVRRVNHCLKFHQMATVDQFRVFAYVDSNCSSIVDGWLQFAFRKRVQRLQLLFCAVHYSVNNYAFPSAEMLQKQLSPSCPFNTNHSNPRDLCAGICNLRVIELFGVDINQETLEYMLLNCLFLEQLSVSAVHNLTGLNVPSQAQRLKCLDLKLCRGMKTLVISESNLTSLLLIGSKVTLSLENVPLLSQLFVGGEHCEMFIQALPRHCGLLSQLKKLSLCMSYKIVRESVFLPQEVPQLSNLEHLELFMRTDDGLCLLWPTILLKGAPFLHKLSGQCGFCGSNWQAPESGVYGSIRRRLEENTEFTHQCLKVVELKCFFGSRKQLELAEQMLCIAKSLDKLVLDVGRIEDVERKHELLNFVEKLANELRSGLPSGAELILRK